VPPNIPAISRLLIASCKQADWKGHLAQASSATTVSSTILRCLFPFIRPERIGSGKNISGSRSVQGGGLSNRRVIVATCLAGSQV